jgi:hypothetical protein
MKTIIAGSKDFNDYELLKQYVTQSLFEISEVVCGGAKGVDDLGLKWAMENNKNLKIFMADWKVYGKSAGPIRNKQMADYCDQALIICNNKSPGSTNMIDNMVKTNKPYYVVHMKDMQPIQIIKNGMIVYQGD